MGDIGLTDQAVGDLPKPDAVPARRPDDVSPPGLDETLQGALDHGRLAVWMSAFSAQDTGHEDRAFRLSLRRVAADPEDRLVMEHGIEGFEEGVKKSGLIIPRRRLE